MRLQSLLYLIPVYIELTRASALPSDANIEARQTSCGTYTVPEVAGGFRTRKVIDVSTSRAGRIRNASCRTDHGLYISDWPVLESPPLISRTFTPSNVQLVDGALALKASAYTDATNASHIMSAEIGTTEEFRYGSVRTVQRSSSVDGVCEGNFFYLHDIAEIDFEILTSTIDQSSACVPKGIWATTHPPEGAPGQSTVSKIFQFTFDPRNDFHEYRIDWSPTTARYYIDGVYQGEITEHVPRVAGKWLWNAWSNGDPCWSAGPPKTESSTLIKSITIYKDYVPQASGTLCPV